MTPPATHHESDEYTRAQRWLILSAVMLGTLMTVIDASIINVAIPSMMGNLGATLTQITWVSTGYIIANVIMLPLTGWCSTRFGRRRFLVCSMILFTVASLFCGMSTSLSMLVAFRILQGAGGAALLSTAQATMMEIFPVQQLGMVQAIYGIGVMVGPTVGPTLGGWITDNFNWPWIFFINLPIGILAVTLTWLFMHDARYRHPAGAGVDWTGIALLAVGLGCLQMMLEEGNREGWFQSAEIWGLAIVAAVGLCAFIGWELRVEHPAVNLRILQNRSFAAGTLYGAVVGVGLYGGLFILPVFLQQLRHYTAQQTGVLMLPGAIATTIMMPVIGRLVGKISARTLVLGGALLFTVSTFMFTTLTMETGAGDIFWPLVLRGAALGFLFVPLSLATLTGLRGREIAEGTGLFSLARQLGGSVGIALLSTFVDHQTWNHRGVLAESVNLYNPLAVQRLDMLTAFFMSKGASAVTAGQQALAAIGGVMQQQATLLAFRDAFVFIGLIFLASLPLLFLLKHTIPGLRPSAAPPAE